MLATVKFVAIVQWKDLISAQLFFGLSFSSKLTERSPYILD